MAPTLPAGPPLLTARGASCGGATRLFLVTAESAEPACFLPRLSHAPADGPMTRPRPSGRVSGSQPPPLLPSSSCSLPPPPPASSSLLLPPASFLLPPPPSPSSSSPLSFLFPPPPSSSLPRQQERLQALPNDPGTRRPWLRTRLRARVCEDRGLAAASPRDGQGTPDVCRRSGRARTPGPRQPGRGALAFHAASVMTKAAPKSHPAYGEPGARLPHTGPPTSLPPPRTESL